MQGDLVKRMLSNPWSQADQSAKVHDRSEHHSLYCELLYTMQEYFPSRAVPLDSLLLA
jgi:hypothetical protein